jgi:hypothetical protein
MKVIKHSDIIEAYDKVCSAMTDLRESIENLREAPQDKIIYVGLWDNLEKKCYETSTTAGASGT